MRFILLCLFFSFNLITLAQWSDVLATQNINTCCYKLNASNVWQQLGVRGLGFNYTGLDDLMIAPNNQPFLITSQIASDKANCVYFDGGTWVKSCGMAVSDTTASSVAMDINAQSVVYAIYNDVVQGKAIVRKCGSARSGINELVHHSFNIYPNPFKDKTTFHTDDHLSNATLTVVNYLGQPIKQINHISGQNVTISREELVSGLYFVRLTEANKLVAQAKLLIIN